MQIEEVMGGSECRHSETGLVRRAPRLGQEEVRALVARASSLHEQGNLGGALATLKIVKFGAAHLLPTNYLGVRQQVHAAIEGMSRV